MRFSALGLGRRQGQILERSPTELTLSTKRSPATHDSWCSELRRRARELGAVTDGGVEV